jgi:Ca2+-binding EF-hand superfamily protein
LLGAFKFCDGDGDGWLCLEDIVSGLDAVHILLGNMIQTNTAPSGTASSDPGASAKQLFAAMDNRGIGRANYDDFKRAVLADSTDGTRDSVLSKEVLQGLIFYDGLI